LNLEFIWKQSVDPYGQRSISTFGNPNFLSAYLIVVIFWITGNIFTGKRKGLWFFMLVLNLFGLGITMTRSSFLGLLAGLLILGYFLIKKFKRYVLLIAVAVFAGGIIFSVLSPQFSERIKSSLSIKKMGSALTQRLLIWESSYNMFADTPLLGRGWGNFEIFYPFYQGKLMEKEPYRNLRTHANNAHNILFELLAQVGIIGTGIYIWLIAVFIYFSAKIYRRAGENEKIRVLVISIAGISFWVDNILNVSLFFPMPAIAFWVNAGFLAAEGRRLYGFSEKRIRLGQKYGLMVFILAAAAAGVIYFNYIYFVSSTHFFKGFKYSRQGKLDMAEKELSACLEMYPFNVDNNYELGNVYARMAAKDNKYLDKAIKAYEAAVKANPGYDEVYFNLGIMYMKKDDFENAEANLDISVRINPLNAEAWRSLGDAKGQQGKHAQAIKMYEKAIELSPQDAILWNNLGYYNEITGDLRESLANYIRALEINPDFNSANLNMRRAIGKYKGFRPVTQINNLFAKADAAVKNQDWDEALKLTEKILEIDPANLKALLYAGNLNFKTSNKERAMKLYSIILAIDPGNQTARRNLDLITRSENVK
jgi:tetratricopeptide (TPR) repeat protein